MPEKDIPLAVVTVSAPADKAETDAMRRILPNAEVVKASAAVASQVLQQRLGTKLADAKTAEVEANAAVRRALDHVLATGRSFAKKAVAELPYAHAMVEALNTFFESATIADPSEDGHWMAIQPEQLVTEAWLVSVTPDASGRYHNINLGTSALEMASYLTPQGEVRIHWQSLLLEVGHPSAKIEGLSEPTFCLTVPASEELKAAFASLTQARTAQQQATTAREHAQSAFDRRADTVATLQASLTLRELQDAGHEGTVAAMLEGLEHVMDTGNTPDLLAQLQNRRQLALPGGEGPAE